MKISTSRFAWFLTPLACVCFWQALATPGYAYIEAAHSFGAVITQSTNIFVMRVESVDREKKVIVYRKVQDIKGKHNQDVIKHNFNNAGLRPNEWKVPLDWAEPGKIAVMFHNGGASETCLGNWWYQAYAGGEWWNHVHGEPFLLRSYCGPPEKLIGIVSQIMEGKEIIVPCMVDGNKEDLHSARGKIQRLKVSLKLQDYNSKRDFVGWGGEDFKRINGMPGFTHISALNRVDPEARAISVVDIDGDGKQDLCLVGGGRVVLLQNNGDSLSEIAIPGINGAHSAVWADYNSDGKPDLLLATTQGLRLYTNLGGAFRDDSHLLPPESQGNITAASWIDYNGDGKPDILFAQGYHGLRLYQNLGMAAPKAPTSPKMGPWYHLGPFDNVGNRFFDIAHPVEKAVDLNAWHVGKGNRKIRWTKRDFQDGQINDLRIFEDNDWAAVYLYREIDCENPIDLPAGFGSDDGMIAWLNGERIIVSNTMRAAAENQERAVLKLKQGKNWLLIKVCQGEAQWAYYFNTEKAQVPIPRGPAFADVSDRVGLGPKGIGAGVKGDSLTICDVNQDGRPDFFYGSSSSLLVLNNAKPGGESSFSQSAKIPMPVGKCNPVFGDFDGDGHQDLVIAHKAGLQLWRNDGKGQLTNVTAKAGALAQFSGWATSVAWGDVDNDGYLDLVVGCLRGCNRVFRNKGDGTFEDISEKMGLTQRIFNTQAVTLVDLNNDGFLDMVFNNESQDSVVLLGNNSIAGKRAPLTLSLAAKEGVIGSRIEIADKQGKIRAVSQISGGEGRGGQSASLARFALDPGTYRVTVRLTSGQIRTREITIGTDPVRARIEEPAEQALAK